MKFQELTTQTPKTAKRVGRGIAAGQGKTAGRGTKGQMSRTGARKKPGFEGGQNPLMQRMPKMHGFRSYKAKAENITVGQLEVFGGKTVDSVVLAEAGLVSSPYARIKLLAGGELTKSVTVKLQAASEGAQSAIQKAGGSFEKVDMLARPATQKDEK